MMKRALCNCRLKTRVAIFGFAILLISSVLMYRALSSHAAKTSEVQNSLPTFDYRHPLRLLPKHSDLNIPSVYNNGEEFHNQDFQKEIWNANLIPKEFKNLKDRDLLSADSKEALTNFLSQLYPTNWAKAQETDEVALELKHLLVDYGFESSLSCKDIDRLRLGNAITFSRSKFVEYGYEGDDESGGNSYMYEDQNRFRVRSDTTKFAIKSPSQDTEIKIACMKQVYDADLCSTMGNYRMLREILLLSTLHHPSLLLMKGYCLRGNRVASKIQEKGIIVVTEVGVSLSQTIMYRSTWPQRIAMALQVARLLEYMESSPFGSLRFSKLEMKDFVLVEGQFVKLADLDDIEIGERTCHKNEHCNMPGIDRAFPCTAGFCDGLNAMLNLQLAVREILKPMLRNPPTTADQTFVDRMLKLELKASELTAQLKTMFKKSPPESRVQAVRPDSARLIDNRAFRNKVEPQDQQEEHKVDEDRINRIQGLIEGRIGKPHAIYHFTRHDQQNFAAMFDYPCEGSRVTWGCVLTVTSLDLAANMCEQDPMCQAFVTLTNTPESERLMTVLLKNDTSETPSESSGTTLFIRMSDKATQGQVNVHGERVGDREAEKKSSLVRKSSTEMYDCVERTQELHNSARYSREKRLMAHLGLKGIREQAWRRSALQQKMGTHSRLVRSEGGGGKFMANLTKQSPDDPEEKAKKVMFISEEGPQAYHVAYALVYNIDRLLGLYHTPPCVGKQLSTEDVKRYQENINWEETFRPLIESDGTLPGMLVAPTPKVMKVSKLTLDSLSSMIEDVVQFDRPNKLQLEYVLLWWLGSMNKRSNDHLGYKGHLIHFNADLAFTDTSLDLSGYLNHCQFPNVAFKSLNCYRCDSTDNTPPQDATICSFGEEVIRRTQAMFADDTQIFIHGMRTSEIMAAINQAATSILRLAESCIKKFGRENVLY